jgi:ABC-type Na+ efflux pump permease subunit
VKGFDAVLRAELRDLRSHPLLWIGLAATAVAAVAAGRHEPVKDNGWVVYQAGLDAAARTAGFFLLGMAAVSVAGDRTRGTVRWILPRPLARGGYVLGKAAALVLVALGFLAVASGASWATAAPHGFGDVRAELEEDEDDAVFRYVEDEEVEPAFRASAMRGRAAFATLLVLPALLTATGLGLLVSALLASAAGAVILSLAVVVPLNYLPEVTGLSAEVARALPFRAASDFLDQLREFGRHLATASWPDYGGAALLGAFVAALGLPALAAAVFARLDITE